MKSIAMAIVIASCVVAAIFAACTSGVDQYPVIPQTNAPFVGQSGSAPTTPDASSRDAGVGDGGVNGGVNDGGVGDGGLGDGGTLSDALF